MSDYAALVAQLDVLRDRRPRSLERLYGRRGPTPEQAAAHAEQVREWNRQYRAVQRQLKAVRGMTPLLLVPAVKLWPSGARQSGRGQPDRLDTPDAARAKLQQGACAVVRSEDAERVQSGETQRV